VLLEAGSVASAADAGRGKELFATCAACHSGKPDAIGPTLQGVYGRKSGSIVDFRYSTAMKRANLTLGRVELTRLHQGSPSEGKRQSHAFRRPKQLG
jgi:cytochrome c2